MAGPGWQYRFEHDPLSGAASGTFSIGRRTLIALSDGFLVMSPTFLGTVERPTAGDEVLRSAYGQSLLPLGCFFLPGDENVLVDTGFGPVEHEGEIVGGRLLDNLAHHGVRLQDVHIVALTHLHADHVGWVGDATGRPVFPNAKFVLGHDDWEYFMSRDETLEPHIRESLRWLDQQGRLVLQDGEAVVAPGLTRLSAPGHTPGHSLFVVHDRRARMLLLGDALYCPQQLSNVDWQAASDVDPVLARRSREALLRDLDLHGGEAVGSHFPGLVAARGLANPEVLRD
ncbi:MAG TPA: MBL fold metallo-hydrolase [Acidimicrobiales bacterium]|nr:MBL fold metallo-hydrolase [Acidimicrobiales bacterium]